MRITAALALSASFLISCTSMDPGNSEAPVGSLAFRLVDAGGDLKQLGAKTCSLAVSFHAAEIAQDTVLAFASGRWLSPSIPSSQDWRISLIGIDSTGHRIWSGSASGTFGGKETVAASLWTDVPVQAVSAMTSPSLSLVSGSYDLPLKFSRGAGTDGSLFWSEDSLHWRMLPVGGVNIDSGMTLWTRLEDTGIHPRPASAVQKLEILAKQVARPVYAGVVTGLDFPRSFALDSIAGTMLHWSVDSGKTWMLGRTVEMAGPGKLLGFATRPHQPTSDTLRLILDGTVTPRTMTDARDGKIYKVVRIGTQVWMAQNLDFVSDSSVAMDTGMCHVGFFPPSSCAGTLGRKYRWSAVMGLPVTNDTGTATAIGQAGICPAGWHVPSPTEWRVLNGAVGTIEDLAVVWPMYPGVFEGNDRVGFGAYPLDDQVFNNVWFWSAEPAANDEASIFGWSPASSGSDLRLDHAPRRSHLPVRCLKDVP